MSDDIRTRRDEAAPVPHRDHDLPDTPAGTGPETVAEAETAGEVKAGRQASLWADAWRDLRRNPLFLVAAALITVLAAMAAFPGLFTGADPRSCSLSNSLVRPSAAHWFGYDVQGCDYYARVIYGARVSMIIGVAVVAFASLIAILLGSVAGYYGRFTDTLIARLTDVWFAIPTILGAIVILSVLGDEGLFEVSFVLVVLGWPTMLRLMRSSVLSAKEADYVSAAKALGAGDGRIIFKHILPNAIAPVIVYGTILVGITIAAEAALTFLGVGLQQPAISWGLMINEAENRILQTPHLLFFPGAFLSVTVFSFILMGDALRDALDPKGR